MTAAGEAVQAGTYRVRVNGRQVYESSNGGASDAVATRFTVAEILAYGDEAYRVFVSGSKVYASVTDGSVDAGAGSYRVVSDGSQVFETSSKEAADAVAASFGSAAEVLTNS
jgi:hypothetical protein